jgi:dTMP kinase
MTGARFVTFEGGEGAGKSTQVARLRGLLQGAGITAIATREPGGSPFAERVRDVILAPTTPPHVALAETLLFAAARADHIDVTIRPALRRGQWVLCDRFTDSTRVYQGTAAGVSVDTIIALEDLVLDDCRPDLTIILDVPPEIGLERARTRAAERVGCAEAAVTDPYEARDLSFHESLRTGFLDIARSEPDRCVLVDGTKPEEAIATEIWDLVCARLGVGED